jgi:RNA polymerase sigma-70 factor (ECF subfamily)
MDEREEELEWIRRSRAGDAAAFEALVRKYQRMIHALTFRMTGSPADAEDLAQEVFIQLHRQLGSFRGESKFSSWLYRIGINTCLNWKKSQQRRAQLHEEWSKEQEIELGPDNTADVSHRVQAALLKLPDKQRAAIVLTTYENMNHAEAARALGCSETTVSWRIFMARKQLRKLLEIGS